MIIIADPIKFGTDGWRGIIAEDFTFDNVRICAQATCDYLKDDGLAGRGLVVGYDTRFASEDFAAATAEVAAGNSIKVYLCPHPTPTPVISYGVIARKAAGAIVITASHNPARWNGFKLKTEDGTGAPPEVTAELEKRITAIGKVNRAPLPQALGKGLVEYTDLVPAYLKHIAGILDLDELRRAGLKVVFDPMHGTGAGYMQSLLNGGKTKLAEINGERNPMFPGMHQPEPIAANLGRLSAAIKERKADVGIATDGDADRLGIVDENGVFLTTLQVYALLCLYMLEVRGERGTIVKTINSSSMLYKLGKIYDVKVHETPVGFKHIAKLMLDRDQDILIGGEESGGYGFRGHIPERDGIFSGLCFLDLMAKTGKSPSQLVEYLYSKVGPHHFHRLDAKFPAGERQTIIDRLKNNPPNVIDGAEVVKVDTWDGFRFALADGGWLLIRFSGTEPVLRLYAESDSPARVNRLLEKGKEMTGV